MKEADEPKKQFWIDRLTSYYGKRFEGISDTDWIEMLSQFTDNQATGVYRDAKTKAYCLLIRDIARRLKAKGEIPDLYFKKGQIG